MICLLLGKISRSYFYPITMRLQFVRSSRVDIITVVARVIIILKKRVLLCINHHDSTKIKLFQL